MNEKMHKMTLFPTHQVDGHSDNLEATILSKQTMAELLYLKYDQPTATILHPKRGRGYYHDTESDGIYCYKFSDGIAYEC